MDREAVLAITLALLFMGMLPLVFNIQPVETNPITIVVPDDYEKIQWAIGNASNGDTIFVRTGTYYEHVVLSKSVLLIGEDKDSTVIDGSESYHVVRITADYVTITNFTIRNSRHQYADDSAIRIDRHSHNIIKGNVILNSLVSIYLDEAHNNTICDNEIIAPSQWYTIWLKQSHHNIIQKNLITNNSGSGINLWSSNWNTVNGNNVTGIPTLPTANGEGIVLYAGSHSNVVSNNRLVYNKYSGMSLMESEGNVIQGNIMERNYLGIYSWKSSNIIHGNTVSNNHWYGINLYQSNGSIIYHNNFLNNRVSVSPTHDNTWDDGYPSGGNYWSYYMSTDTFSGPYQNETGSDDIWDHEYIISFENNVDRYPLVNPWTPVSPVVATVNVFPDTLNLKSKGNWISAFIELPEGYVARDINVSTILLNDKVVAESSKVNTKKLIVRFDRSEVIALLAQSGEVELTLTGTLDDGTLFEGSDSVRVIFPSRRFGGCRVLKR